MSFDVHVALLPRSVFDSTEGKHVDHSIFSGQNPLPPHRLDEPP